MNAEERAQGLLKLIAGYQAQECRDAIERARAEAREILRRAWRLERDHVHTSVAAERSRARALIQAARAERATRERMSGDRFRAHLLALAWPRLMDKLHERWQDPQGREAWVAQALQAALAVLPLGPWTVRHAPDWRDGATAAPCVALAERFVGSGVPAPRFHADPAVSAGLIVESGTAQLDASLAGLLQDRARLEARLLALLARETAAPDAAAIGAAGAGPATDDPHQEAQP